MQRVAVRLLFALVAVIGVVSVIYVIAANLPQNNIENKTETSDGYSTDELREDSFVQKENSAQGKISEEQTEQSRQTEPFCILICGTDNSHKLTDVIIAARVDPAKNRIAMLQIPRDTYVGDAYPTGKINAVYQKKGAKGLQILLQERFSVATDHYVIISTEAFRDIVDALGGIEMEVPRRIVFTEDRILESGIQTLNGEQAEWFVRYRAGYVTGDIGRMQAQSLFLRALLKTALEKTAAELAWIAGSRIGDIETDISLAEALEMISMIQKDLPDISSEIVPGEGRMLNGFAVYIPDEERLAEIVADIFGNKGNKPVSED